MAKYEVDIDVANSAKQEMRDILSVNNSRLLNDFSSFSALYEFDFAAYEKPILVLKTEEPGSKQLLAMQYDRIESVCYDMINHLINDCIVMGATPLSVQDAIICGKLDKQIVTRIVKAVTEACAAQECMLTGGETSEQPGVLGADTYILTSSIVGVVEKADIIDGGKIEPGQIVLALASNGIHTNGYTLVRKIIAENPAILKEKIAGEAFIEAVLKPHQCYYLALKDLFGKDMLTGLAHITGGGIKENLNRILPKKVDALIDLSTYQVPEIFTILQKYGSVADAEMLRTFNMGVGIAAVVRPVDSEKVIAQLAANGVDAYPIGQTVSGNGEVQTLGEMGK